MMKWNPIDSKPTVAEVIYCATQVCGGEIDLSKKVDRKGVPYTPRSVEGQIAKIVMTRMLRAYRGMSYPEVSDAIGVATSTLIMACNRPLGTSMAVDAAASAAAMLILNNRQVSGMAASTGPLDIQDDIDYGEIARQALKGHAGAAV